MMKTLIGIGAAALLAASGLWFVGAAASERVVRGWLDVRAEEGWSVTYETVDTSGFPDRFTTVVTDLNLADPTTGWAWIASEFTLSQRPWRPDHIQAIWPATQSFASPFDRVEIRAETLVADLDVQPTANWALDASRTEMRAVVLESPTGGTTTLSSGTWEMVRQDGEAARYDVVFEALDLSFPEEVKRLLDPTGELPATFNTVRYTADMGFDRPWDMEAVEARRPQITHLTLDELQAEWGALLFRATGALDVDAEGRATGSIAVRAENWRQMLDVATRAGALPQSLRGTAESVLGLIAGLSGRPEDIDATLRFDDGFLFFGPLPIGEAPRLILR